MSVEYSPAYSRVPNDGCLFRMAAKEEEEKLAAKASHSVSKIAVPGTPRTVGVGAGTRAVMTPRRRLGI